MNEEITYEECPRCESKNHPAHNFCWLCGLQLVELEDGHIALEAKQQRNRNEAAAVVTASVGSGIAGILAGAAGGIAIGIAIVIALIVAVLNAIGEFLESCSGALIFMVLTFYGVCHAVVSWFF